MSSLKIYRLNNDIIATRISLEDTIEYYNMIESSKPVIKAEEWFLRVAIYDVPMVIGEIVLRRGECCATCKDLDKNNLCDGTKISEPTNCYCCLYEKITSFDKK